jgi:hypothetical protein
MNIIRVFFALACVFSIFKGILNIIWVYKPLFFSNSKIYKLNEFSKTEKTCYLLAGIFCMAHYIHSVYLKLNF